MRGGGGGGGGGRGESNMEGAGMLNGKIKMISADSSSNKCKNIVTKELLIASNIFNTVKKNLSIL